MEIIKNIVKVDDAYLGYEIHTDQQVITVFISNSSGCCENWGFLTTEDTISEFIGSELLSLEVIDMDYKSHPLTKDGEWYLEYEDVFCFVDVNTSQGKLQFAIYNMHNGYYGHSVEIKSNQLNYSTVL